MQSDLHRLVKTLNIIKRDKYMHHDMLCVHLSDLRLTQPCNVIWSWTKRPKRVEYQAKFAGIWAQPQSPPLWGKGVWSWALPGASLSVGTSRLMTSAISH